MVDLIGTFHSRQYAYRCAACLTAMTLDHRGSYCPTCQAYGGGFYLPIHGAPSPLPPDLPRTLRVTARRGWRWRWPLGDLLEWDWLLTRA